MKMVRYLSENSVMFYRLKKIYRKVYLYFFHKRSISELMDYDAQLYKEKTGNLLEWKNLRRYTEKIQWAKFFDDDERKVICSDKYKVREWVADRIGAQYLIPLLGKWENSSDICFDELPNSFVLKTNCGSGDVFIVRNKASLSKKQQRIIKAKLDYYMTFDFGCAQCERHYSKIPPCIIAEKYIDYPDSDLPDYKFLCFNGEVKYCWVDMGRYHNHKRNVYDMNWKLQEWNQKDYGNYEEQISKPENFDIMVNIAKELCRDFGHVRVDLYNVNGRIYFGEMTFTNGSGFEKINPDSADIMLGDMWNIDTTMIPEGKQ